MGYIFVVIIRSILPRTKPFCLNS